MCFGLEMVWASIWRSKISYEAHWQCTSSLFLQKLYETKVLLGIVYGSFKQFHVKSDVIVGNCVN